MTFLLDLSAIRGHLKPLLSAAEGRHSLHVVAPTYAEKLFQDRRWRARKQSDFDEGWFKSLVARHQPTLQIVAWTDAHAEQAAGNLFTRFPDDQTWLSAKRLVARQFALGEAKGDDPSPGRPCGAPLDLYLAAIASPEVPIITAENTGFEWKDWPVGAVIGIDRAIELMGAP